MFCKPGANSRDLPLGLVRDKVPKSIHVVEVCVTLLWLLVLLMAKFEEMLLWLESNSRSHWHWDDLR